MKRHLFSLAAGIMTLAACTTEKIIDVSPSQGNAIGFENVVNKNTKAVEGDLSIANFDNFLVYGYYTKEGMTTPIQIFNGVPVKKVKNNATGKDEWIYDGMRYWIPKCTYYFYAYSCADVALTTDKGRPTLTLTNENSIDGRALSIMSYICDGTHQHDLVCAENESIVADNKNNKEVAMKFGHALCKVKAVFTTDFPDGYTVKVSNVKLSEFDNLADYNVGTGSWTNHRAEKDPYINLTLPEKNTVTNGSIGIETSEAFLIPEIYKTTDWIKIHFTIEISKDNNVILQRNINGTWSPNWEKAHIYKYNINISGSAAGIEPIVFAATQELGTSAWDDSTEVKMEFGVDAAADETTDNV